MRFKIIAGPLNYRDRLYIAAFAFVNGIDPRILDEALQLNRNCTQRKRDKISELFIYWTDDSVGVERRERYYAYDMIIGRMVTLNGRVCSNEVASHSH